MLTPFLPSSLGQEMVYQSPPPVMWLWQQPASHLLQCSGRMLGPILYIAITLLGVAALLLNSLCNVSCFCWYTATPRHVFHPHEYIHNTAKELATVEPPFSGLWSSNLLALPSTRHYLWPHKINVLFLVSCSCWLVVHDLCKLSIQHAVYTVCTQWP